MTLYHVFLRPIHTVYYSMLFSQRWVLFYFVGWGIQELTSIVFLVFLRLYLYLPFLLVLSLLHYFILFLCCHPIFNTIIYCNSFSIISTIFLALMEMRLMYKAVCIILYLFICIYFKNIVM